MKLFRSFNCFISISFSCLNACFRFYPKACLNSRVTFPINRAEPFRNEFLRFSLFHFTFTICSTTLRAFLSKMDGEYHCSIDSFLISHVHDLLAVFLVFNCFLIFLLRSNVSNLMWKYLKTCIVDCTCLTSVLNVQFLTCEELRIYFRSRARRVRGSRRG